MRRSIHVAEGRSSSGAPAQPHPVPASAQEQVAPRRVKLVLRQAIASGAIPEGTRLTWASIAREFAADPRQVRDALRELAAEGFARLEETGDAVTRELCRSDLEDIYQVRMLLEPLAAARAARLANREDIMRAVKMLAAMGSETDARRWADYNSGFHRVIDESGSSPQLAAILENLRELSACYVRHSILAVPDRADQANAEHEEIMRAVMARDPAAAADATFRHLDGTLSALNVRRLGADPGARVRGL